MLKRPIISEKSMSLAKTGWYTFLVSKDLTKKQIAYLVSNKFNVDVIGVRTITLPAKTKVQKTRKGHYQINAMHKAIVRVKAGQSIGLFENVAVEEETVVTTGEGEPVTLKEKKSLLKGTKVKVEKMTNKKEEAKLDDAGSAEVKTGRQQAGMTKGEK